MASGDGDKRLWAGWRQETLGRLATTASRWIFGVGGNLEWMIFWVGAVRLASPQLYASIKLAASLGWSHQVNVTSSWCHHQVDGMAGWRRHQVNGIVRLASPQVGAIIRLMARKVGDTIRLVASSGWRHLKLVPTSG